MYQIFLNLRHNLVHFCDKLIAVNGASEVTTLWRYTNMLIIIIIKSILSVELDGNAHKEHVSQNQLSNCQQHQK